MTVGYETGRSMVEMLGVLAVMGILSVAGIAGYNNAMNRHHANTIIEEAKMHSVLLSGQALLICWFFLWNKTRRLRRRLYYARFI